MIYLGADHNGFALKEEVKMYLEQQGYEFRDLGNTEFNAEDDYPDFGFPVATQVSEEEDHRGILLCGSGVGMAMVANKVSGVRAGLIGSEEQAIAARRDDNINVLCLAAQFIDREEVYPVVEAFLSTGFREEGKYQKRLDKITEHESLLG